ncbi:MAG: Type 1 glutamine amidotransferase-like domain-containing protein [Candidatus Beckwithbacteria bacterium]
MSIIFVSGGGSAKDSYLLDREFVKFLPNRKILYIPVGLERGISGYEGCFEWLTKTLARHAKQKLDISMWINLKCIDRENITKYGSIYIGGALNTYKLMSIFIKHKIDILLNKFLKGNGVLYGGSSGGVVFGKNISTFEKEKDSEGVGERGLNLIGGYSIYCHLMENNIDQVARFVKQKKTPVIAMPENSGIFLKNKTIKVIGYSRIVVAGGEKRGMKFLNPGDTFEL